MFILPCSNEIFGIFLSNSKRSNSHSQQLVADQPRQKRVEWLAGIVEDARFRFGVGVGVDDVASASVAGSLK